MNNMNKNRSKSSRLFMLAIFMLLFCSMGSMAQVLKGKVSDSQKEPLPGVTVMLKGDSNVGTISDMNGAYSLMLKNSSTDVIVVSFIGMQTQEIAVNGRDVIDIVLQDSYTQLDEVVAVGYGTVKKRDITGSVSSVSGDALQAIPVASAAEAMQGRMAGVQISSTEGSPDAEMNIRVRGGGSITQDNSPLIIVDGFPVNSISDISPSDIESIDVLKDASSTAIYGSRGANGVVIVTTKNGKEGKVSVSYNAFYGIKKIAKKLDVLDAEDYVNWQYEYAVLDNDGTDEIESYTRYFGNYQDIDQYNGKVGNNWQEQVYGRTGKTQSHDLAIRGGSEKMNYSFSYARFDEKAIMIGSDFVRDNATLKLNSMPNDKVELAFSVRYSDTRISGGGANEQEEKSSADSRLKHSVTYSPIPLEGITGGGEIDEEVSSYLINPITATWDNDRKQRRRNYNLAGSFSWEAFENLIFKTEVGYSNDQDNDDRFYGLTTYYVKNAPAGENQNLPASILSDRKRNKIRNTNTLNYDFKNLVDGGHSLKLLAGQEIIRSEDQKLESVLHGFPEQFTSADAFSLTTQGTPFSVDNFYSPDDKLLSFFGRANYDFKSKYILSATFRADGSSKFGDENRWGYFPSAAAAWRVSSESFMNGTKGWLDDLKLRLSYGTAGNNNIPSGKLAQMYASNTTAWINGFESYWAPEKIMANPELKWETTITRNIGLDFAMFGSRLNGTIEVYKNNTKDLLIKFPIGGTGYDYQYRNMGETQNQGVEFSANWVAIDKRDYGLNLSFNIGFNDNEIISLGSMEDFGEESGWASTEIGNDFMVSVGGTVGEMYGYRSDGMYKISDFESYDQDAGKWILKEGVADASQVVGDLAPGMMKLKNIYDDPDSETDNGIVDGNDKEVIGNANPIATGGFSISGRVKGFDLSAVFNYSYGNDIYNANKIEYTTSTPRYKYRNMISSMESGKRWTNIEKSTGEMVTDANTLAAMNAGTTMWSPYMARYVFSDWAVEDGSFLRLSTLSLGYTLPSTITNRIKVSRLRVYATAYNLFLLTDYSGFDPEVSTRRKTPLTPGVDYSAYPRSRQIVFGLNLNF